VLHGAVCGLPHQLHHVQCQCQGPRYQQARVRYRPAIATIIKGRVADSQNAANPPPLSVIGINR
jgi:hypothetical protein